MSKPKEIVEHKLALETKSTTESIFIKNTEKFILLNVPVGKPNRNPKSAKSLPRVIQPAQKGPFCYYYALKINAMMKDDYLKRQAEAERKIASEYRKGMTKIYVETEFLIPMLHAFLNSHYGSDLRSTNKEVVVKTLRECTPLAGIDPDSCSPLMVKCLSNGKDQEAFRQFVDDFANAQSADLLKFVEERHLRNRIGEGLTFLRRLNLDPIEECQKIENYRKKQIPTIPSESNLEENFEKIKLDNKERIVIAAVEHKLSEIFGLKSTTWKPDDNIDVLFKLISDKREPMVFSGYYGPSYYTGKEGLSKKENHYDVYECRESTRVPFITSDNSICHCVNIIGVEKDSNVSGLGWVYYIDPEEESSPFGKKSTRKISRMDYKTFCTYAIDDTNASWDRDIKLHSGTIRVKQALRAPQFKYGLMS